VKELFITIGSEGIVNKKQVRQFFGDLPPGKWLLKAERKDKRSSQQNRYLHGVMLPIIRDALKDAGWNMIKTVEDAKDFVKVKFLKYDMPNEATGEVVEMYRNTSALTKIQFMELVQDVQIWLMEFFSIELPLPGEQTAFFKQS
jgi:hypothetical protein